jgi:hypothetical protein
MARSSSSGRKALPDIGILHVGEDQQKRLPPDGLTLPGALHGDHMLVAVASVSAWAWVERSVKIRVLARGSFAS